MKPHLVRWHKELGSKGLVVIDVDDGTQDTQQEVKDYVAKGSFPFAVLWDKDGKNVATYKVQAMPAAYLIGTDGKVVWEGHPDPSEPGALEALIKAELGKVKK
jgi:hypothetical protein